MVQIDERYVLKPLPDDGRRGFRVEIDEFLSNNAMTNLFLIALRELQKKSLEPLKENDPNWLNFYALAGIHGFPTEQWCGLKDPHFSYGYCHHRAETFPVWHRPYMALYEMMIYKEMVAQAEKYKDEAERQMYRDAAAMFRLPFWDIVMPRSKQTSGEATSIFGCPEILKREEVFLKLPEGHEDRKSPTEKFTKLPNPLASFIYPQNAATHNRADLIAKLKDKRFKDANYNTIQTARVPTVRSKGLNDNEQVDKAISRQAVAAAVMVGQMLNPDFMQKSKIGDGAAILVNQHRSWSVFSNHDAGNAVTVDGKSYAALSLESFHDSIHVLLGTGMQFDFVDGNWIRVKPLNEGSAGVMGNPAFAAFDPIFWLHHNNIERLLCIYQGIYPDKYLSDPKAEQKMIPFLKDTAGNFFDCKDDAVKGYWTSGFAVPGNKKEDATRVRDACKAYLANTYYWASNFQPKDDIGKLIPGWPKDLTRSWALYGPDARPDPPKPTTRITALAVEHGQARLVSRKINFSSLTPSGGAEQPPLYQDTTIEVSDILDKIELSDFTLPRGALTGPASTTNPPDQVTWNAHVRVRKFAFNGSFSVHAFIGPVDDEKPDLFMTKKNEAGFTGVFATPDELMGGCSSCRDARDADVIYEDVIPLTTILYDYLDARPGNDDFIPASAQHRTIPNLEVVNVVPFLEENLNWRIIDLASNLISGQEQQAKLEILVTSRAYTPPTEANIMGVYGPYQEHLSITNTKPGGAGYTYPTAT